MGEASPWRKVVLLLLALSGDVETNPGPPKRAVRGVPESSKKPEPQEEPVEKVDTTLKVNLIRDYHFP